MSAKCFPYFPVSWACRHTKRAKFAFKLSSSPQFSNIYLFLFFFILYKWIKDNKCNWPGWNSYQSMEVLVRSGYYIIDKQVKTVGVLRAKGMNHHFTAMWSRTNRQHDIQCNTKITDIKLSGTRKKCTSKNIYRFITHSFKKQNWEVNPQVSLSSHQRQLKRNHYNMHPKTRENMLQTPMQF